MKEEMVTEKEGFRTFWDMKAKRYPLPFDRRTLEKTEQVISMAREKGVEIRGSQVIDIGCGTGIFTLPLAQEALAVTGLDFSEVMLARLREESARLGITNVNTVSASWKDTDIQTLGFRKGYDIAWSSMSMAVRDQEDLLKMEDCARRWCVFIGWGSVRKNALLEEAFRMHSLEHRPPRGAYEIYSLLKNSGRRPTLEFIDTSWSWEGTVDEAVEDISGHIRLQGAEPDKDRLREFLSHRFRDGMVLHTTYVEEGIVVWQPE